jgi:Fe-Mn family superoxide dismutase
MMTRRQAIGITGMAATALMVGQNLPEAEAAVPSAVKSAVAEGGPFKLPPLPYAYDALEPYIDAQTMHIHHDKHHAGYVANLNKAVAEYPDLGKKSVEDLLKDLDMVPEKIRVAVKNNGGGHYNHSLFWQMMKKKGGGEPSFGSYLNFKKEFSEAAGKVLGSGWAWLVGEGWSVQVMTTANQDSPISVGKKPLLGLDVWEHAYYLKRQNRRAEYIEAFWNVVDWDFVLQRYKTV